MTERDANNVLNITIVDDYLNKRQIRTDPPSAYLKRFAEANPDIEKAMASHLIGPLEKSGNWADNYASFLQKRADLVSAELRKRVIARPIDQRGQVVRTDDVDEQTDD